MTVVLISLIIECESMNKITYPLKFEPVLQENIWGGDYLKTRSSIIPIGTVGESWEISDYKEDTTKIINGAHQGKSLHEIIDLIYPDSQAPERFPLLLKILAPESELSVQVHPTDSYATENALDDTGKAESWYILDAPDNAFLYLGLKERLTPDLLKQAIHDGTLEADLNKVYVKKGDVVNIPHGTIHSLCPFIKVFEIQQSSNITYRLFDWNRVDNNGKGRTLHIHEALEVINFDYLPESHLVTPEVILHDNYKYEKFVKNSNFAMDKISDIKAAVTLNNVDQKIYIITSLNSHITVTAGGVVITLEKYDSCLIPALSGEITINGDINSELLIFS